MTIGNDNLEGDWIIDSGASSNMISNRDFFDELKQTTGEVELAVGRVVAVTGTGTGVIECVNGSGTVNEIRLNDVMYAPKLSANLLSVITMTNRKADVSFHGEKCKIAIDGNEVAIAVKSRGLYRLKNPEKANAAKVSQTHKRDCQHTWHRRFEHREAEVLNTLMKKNLINGMKVADCGIREDCEYEGSRLELLFRKTQKRRPAPLRTLSIRIYVDNLKPLR